MYIGRDSTVEHNQTAKVSNAELKYAVVGSGEPVICIHGTNIADSLITPFQFYSPLLEEYQMISYYRAGYNGSTMEKDSVSIEEGAEHAVQLLDHLGIQKAHLVGFSLGGVIAFEMMLSYPERIHSAMLLEPYLPRESQAGIDANVAAFMRANELYQAGDKLAATQAYLEDLCGPSFLSAVEMTGPLDIWERVEECVDTAFTVDFPAVMNWGFSASKADQFAHKKPQMPVLAVMGLDSEAILPGFRETQAFLMNWLPQAERAGIIHATHGMLSMNPVAVGDAIYRFMKKYPMKS
ncbi:MAG: alpha/beta fold hydrolase [Ardenticatenaceae bacterium]